MFGIMCTSDSKLDKIKTRTATINHECGIVLLQPLENYYTNTYNDYKDKGYSDSSAAQEAFADTAAYIPKLKYMTVQACEDNYDFFKAIFTAANIMDLHNNCYGGAYPGDYPSLDYKEAYYSSKNKKGMIIIIPL
ncbi:hypothetical protein [Caloranaerobacter sp. DY30410]|uniref:hypothetical protein n=1 Tax=Caloranaerobacter sp. DY30410 TaxID=3238305 RepID=UPI003D015199